MFWELKSEYRPFFGLNLLATKAKIEQGRWNWGGRGGSCGKGSSGGGGSVIDDDGGGDGEGGGGGRPDGHHDLTTLALERHQNI